MLVCTHIWKYEIEILIKVLRGAVLKSKTASYISLGINLGGFFLSIMAPSIVAGCHHLYLSLVSSCLSCISVSVVLRLLMVILAWPHSFLSMNPLISLSKDMLSQEVVLKELKDTGAGFALCSYHYCLFSVLFPHADSGYQ